jgi:hypothetical protein
MARFEAARLRRRQFRSIAKAGNYHWAAKTSIKVLWIPLKTKDLQPSERSLSEYFLSKREGQI